MAAHRNRARWSGLVGIGLGMLASACGAQVRYTFVPTESVSARVLGLPAARYPLPPESPRGSLSVASFGLVELPERASDGSAAAIAVRLVVSNDDAAAPFRIDTRAQLLQIPGAGRSRPVYVNSDVPGTPTLEIAPGQKHTLDLYYPLPADLDDASDLPSYDLIWQVATAARVVAGRTPFARIEQQSAPPPRVVWGPYWWYDPLWVSVTFAHPWFGYRAWPHHGYRHPYYRPAPRSVPRTPARPHRR